ncbi:hypothetical protein [Pseudomonas urmiensis]|uniref:hypothetical protein n=1 Tax=Pseudomonas urmiensis TaxID=2745493 RepID=UPI003C9F9795
MLAAFAGFDAAWWISNDDLAGEVSIIMKGVGEKFDDVEGLRGFTEFKRRLEEALLSLKSIK